VDARFVIHAVNEWPNSSLADRSPAVLTRRPLSAA